MCVRQGFAASPDQAPSLYGIVSASHGCRPPYIPPMFSLKELGLGNQYRYVQTVVLAVRVLHFRHLTRWYHHFALLA